MGMIIKPIFYFTVRKFVCKPGATTNIYLFPSHFASHILGLSVQAIFNIRKQGGFTEPSKPSLEYHWSDNQ